MSWEANRRLVGGVEELEGAEVIGAYHMIRDYVILVVGALGIT